MEVGLGEKHEIGRFAYCLCLRRSFVVGTAYLERHQFMEKAVEYTVMKETKKRNKI